MTKPNTPPELIDWIRASIRNGDKHGLASLHASNALQATLLQLKDLVLDHSTRDLQRSHPNPLNHFGRKCFSQADEDGITLEIIRRLGIKQGVFGEFGVGNGLENNTLILGALGWRGFWVGAEPLAFDSAPLRRLAWRQAWITRDNAPGLAAQGLSSIGARAPDLLSVDLDGNDLHVVRRLLESGLRPRLFIVEYNAKFPPPARFQIRYDPEHRWAGDDYFGAALMNFVELFAEFGFTLVCCNAQTGCNAFFVRNEDRTAFADVPTDLGQLYMPPRYQVHHRQGHPTSPRVIEAMFAD